MGRCGKWKTCPHLGRWVGSLKIIYPSESILHFVRELLLEYALRNIHVVGVQLVMAFPIPMPNLTRVSSDAFPLMLRSSSHSTLSFSNRTTTVDPPKAK